jgi:hypothetical protein
MSQCVCFSVERKSRVQILRVILLVAVLVSTTACASFGTLDFAYSARSTQPSGSEPTYASGYDHPQRCLALSGGGVRSAAYGIGVMKALSEHGLMDNLDLVSSVSGGGYAAAWYFQQLPAFDGDSRLLFTSQNIDKVIDRGSRGVRVFSWFMNGTLVAAAVPLAIGLSIYDNLTLGLLNPPGHANLSGVYQIALLLPYGSTGSEYRSTEKLGRYLRSHKLPEFIFNMTIQDRESERLSAHGEIYEVTTWGVGSEYNGFITYKEALKDVFLEDLGNWNFNEITAISGAASSKPLQGCSTHSVFDACPWEKAWAYVRMYTGLTLGYTVWGLKERQVDDKVYYFLSDGGHSENLGAYSLIRRQCKNIIVIDAEEDHRYVFEGYITLRSLVKRMLDAKFEVKDIDDHLAGHAKCEHIDGKLECPEPVGVWELGSMQGTISGPSTSDQSVTYLKLSIDRTRGGHSDSRVIGVGECALQGTSPSPETYYSASVVSLMKNDPDFPMYKTLNQWITTEQRKGLIDLGYATMKDAICRGMNP